MMTSHIRSVIRFALLACGVGTLAITTTLEAQQVAAPVVQYFYGPSEVYLPSGQKVGSSTILIKRQIWRDEGLMMEEVSSLDSRPGSKVNQLVTVARWDGTHMKIIEKDGAFRGEGELVGEVGRWTSWSSTSTLSNGSQVQSEDKLSPDKLVVRKRVLLPNGSVQVELRETLAVVEEAQYRENLAKLLAGK